MGVDPVLTFISFIITLIIGIILFARPELINRVNIKWFGVALLVAAGFMLLSFLLLFTKGLESLIFFPFIIVLIIGIIFLAKPGLAERVKITWLWVIVGVAAILVLLVFVFLLLNALIG